MAILDGYVIKKAEYLAEQELSTTKSTTTHTDVNGNVLGFETSIVKTSLIRLIPNINYNNFNENKPVYNKKKPVLEKNNNPKEQIEN